MIKYVLNIFFFCCIGLSVFAQQNIVNQPVVKAIPQEQIIQKKEKTEHTVTAGQPLYQQTRALKAIDTEQRSINAQQPLLKAHTRPTIYTDIDERIRDFELKIVKLKKASDTDQILLDKNEASLERLKQIRSMRRNGQ